MRNWYYLITTVLLLTVLTGCQFQEDTAQNSTPTSQGSGGGSGGGGGGGASHESVSLAWAIPSTRTDGSNLPITELAGYRIYMGTTAGELRPLVELEGGTATEYTVENLASGNYYFAISAFDTSGLESGLSQVLLKQTS